MEIKLTIIDDHPLILEGTKKIFENEKHICANMILNSETTLTDIKRTHADIYLIDINMKHTDGITLATQIRKISPSIKIVLYTGDSISNYFSYIINKIIDGIISKESSPNYILDVIYQTAKGNLIMPEGFIDFIQHQIYKDQPNIKFSKKEKILINFIDRGLTSKQMASELDLSQRTIERYLQQLYTVLKVNNREEAVLKIKTEKI